MRRRGPSRLPGFVNLAVATVVFLVVIAVALRASQTSPPAIAEFAPQAQQQIRQAPLEQTSLTGQGEDGLGQGAAASSPSPTGVAASGGGALDRGRVRKCIGSPPRQIEDPQSPPCVPYFQGDNGGSTWKGVTRNSIAVAIPSTSSGAGSGSEGAELNDLIAFFNKRFEFYGRKLVVAGGAAYAPCGSGGANTVPCNPAGMEADAAMVDTQLGAFADLSYQDDQRGRDYHFYDELANRKILSVQYNYSELTNADQGHFSAFRPYEWNYVPSPDVIERIYSDFVCNSLAGNPAKWAGPALANPTLNPKRVFGVVYQTNPDGTPPVSLQPLEAGTARCGIQWHEASDQDGDGQSTAENLMLTMKNQGVTTVLCMCHTSAIATHFMPAASSEGYQPEWMISDYLHADDDFAASFYPRDQAIHTFGLQSINKLGPGSQDPACWAVKEMNPAYSSPTGGCPDHTYHNLLVLAAGIQMAGPILTPENFENGLFRTRFPNPGADGPPYYQARVGFGPGDHTMQQTVAPIWWSSQQGLIPGTTASYCYVNGGERFGIGEWPRGPIGLFSGSCR